MELAYNGEDYFGWQRQPNQISVQETIEDALSRVHSNRPIKVVGCGRTDTGVHAKHYVLHVDLPLITDPTQFVSKLNIMLPRSIALSSVYPVDNEKHARFDAKSRTYRYYIHTTKDPFIIGQSWFLKFPLDYGKMNKAAEYLCGKQDFTSFSKIHTDVKTNICEVTAASWTVMENGDAYFEITSDRFLRNMVRAIVGTLVDVGMGKINHDSILAILSAKDRQAASSSVPAHGLFLWRVEY